MGARGPTLHTQQCKPTQNHRESWTAWMATKALCAHMRTVVSHTREQTDDRDQQLMARSQEAELTPQPTAVRGDGGVRSWQHKYLITRKAPVAAALARLTV